MLLSLWVVQIPYQSASTSLSYLITTTSQTSLSLLPTIRMKWIILTFSHYTLWNSQNKLRQFKWLKWSWYKEDGKKMWLRRLCNTQISNLSYQASSIESQAWVSNLQVLTNIKLQRKLMNVWLQYYQQSFLWGYLRKGMINYIWQMVMAKHFNTSQNLKNQCAKRAYPLCWKFWVR